MSSTIFPTTTAAASSNVVTPTIDELEQAAFYAQEQAGVHDGQQQQVLLQHSEYHHHSSNDAPPSLPTLESMVDAALPSSASFYSPASLDVEGTSSLEENYYDTNMMCIGEKNFASFASVAALAAPSPQEFIAIQEHSSPLPLQSKEDAMEAANILCQFKNNVVQSQSSCTSNTSNSSSMDCSPPPPPAPTDAMADIVDMAVEMLTGQTCAELYEHDGEEEDGIAPLDSTQFPPQDESITYTDTSSVAAPAKKKKKAAALPPLPLPSSESLHHPSRLATSDDHEEVNKLHQYVRSNLLEIFVVPKVDSSNADSDSSEDEDNGSSDSSDDEENAPIASLTKKKSNANAAPTTTRRLVTRRRSISISSNSTASNSIANRHYPGRVGIRCVHCACIRNKSTSKSAFFPLRLKNIYREVCAWQRIHFKKCTHVPRSVRERYDYCKRIDTSRGKVRYWESSAKKVGLVNNPNRDDGIVFANTAWRA